MDKWDTGIFVSKCLLNAFQLRRAQGWNIGRNGAVNQPQQGPDT